MTEEEINKLYKKKNLIELLSHTLIGLSLVKARYKEYKNDSGCYGYEQLVGVTHAENLVKQYLCKLIN